MMETTSLLGNTSVLAHFAAAWLLWERLDLVARAIALLLLLASLGSWYLILFKGVSAWTGGRAERRYLAAFAAAGQRPDGVAQWRPAAAPAAYAELLALVQAGHLRTTCGVQANPACAARKLGQAFGYAIEQQQARWEAGQTYLATVASSAPFVGLLGTVWGVYHALQAIGQASHTAMNQVAGPVGEALIMTGIGLAVALPAAIAYNTFARITHHRLRQLHAHASRLQEDRVGGCYAAR